MAAIFKGVLGVVHLGYALRYIVGMVKVGWGEVTVRRFEDRRDEGQPEFRNVQDFCRGQRFHNRTLVRAHNGHSAGKDYKFEGTSGESHRIAWKGGAEK